MSISFHVELIECFEMFDRNGDGTISVEELGSILRALGQNPTQAQVNDFMKKADKNGELFFLSFQSNTCTVNFISKERLIIAF